MSARFVPLCVAITAAFATAPAGAQPLLCSMLSSKTQNLNGSRQTVTVLPGIGTNIDFTLTQEFVKKIWLDDFSRVTVDTDAPLCAATGKDGAVMPYGGCDRGGAKIVHLRRIEQLKIPHLPSTPTTLLSVVTEDEQQMRLYEFQVNYDSKSPQCSRLSILPEPANKQFANSSLNVASANASVVTVEQGLQVAVARNLVAAEATLVERVQNFLTLMRQGTAEGLAARQAGISMALVAKLRELGLGQQLRQGLNSPALPLL